MSKSSSTPIQYPKTENRSALRIAVGGFGTIFISALGNAIKDLGVSGTAKVVVEVVSRSWYMGLVLLLFSFCWIAWLMMQALRDQAKDFRDHAIRTDEQISESIHQQSVILSQKMEILRQQSSVIEMINRQVQALPELVARAVSEVTHPKVSRGELYTGHDAEQAKLT